jgi:hypothetical protein
VAKYNELKSEFIKSRVRLFIYLLSLKDHWLLKMGITIKSHRKQIIDSKETHRKKIIFVAEITFFYKEMINLRIFLQKM